ncbi:hypothetical protein [Cupriavidus pinatubonensis]|uniref:hypothetical protein n=1 Tax=Cupriavidus pinatubonensis TaxID=248026 RepID=UPI002159E32E|nr:hypothetical protein [Cupriavidus pinatubonensis]
MSKRVSNMVSAAPSGKGKKVAIVAPDQDALARYVPDLQNWPASWRFDDQDLPPGQALVEVFTPFLQHLLTLGYARKTLNYHRDHLWMLGGHLIEVRHEDPDAAAMDARTLVLHQIHKYGGPLISRHLDEQAQSAFDATCKKLYRFLCPS